MTGCQLDLLLARAQVWLATLFSMGFIGVIFTLIFYHQNFTPDGRAMLTGLAGVLGTIVTQQSGYFFARHRPQTPIDGKDDDDNIPLVKPPETKT